MKTAIIITGLKGGGMGGMGGGFDWEPGPGDGFAWNDIRGYKYRTKSQYQIQIPILGQDIQTEYIDLNAKGTLTIKAGYAWDGASGPTKDTKKSKRGSCIHDALYQLMRMMRLNYKTHREIADEVFYKILLADGMNRFRAWYWRRGVRRYAEFAARPEGE